MSDAPYFKVVAKLPLLGPVIGWTRQNGQGGLDARIWIRVDDAESEPALVALTALCEPDGRVRRDSVQVWKLARLHPAETQTHQSLDFAVADVALPADAGDCTVRMVSLHRITFADEDESRPVFDERQARPGTIGGLGGDEVLQARLKASGEPWAESSIQQRLSSRQLPRPEQVHIDILLPQLAGKLERLADEAFRNIGEALADARRTTAQPIPGTLSRKRLHVREFSECEARLSQAARRQLSAGTPSIAFAAGCCRHPGNGFESEVSGRAMQALASAADSPGGPAFALLTGDQIYADAMGGIFDVEERFEKFVTRYQRAFDANAFRAVASRIPLYMAADDHEIADGWSRARLRAMNLGSAERAANKRAYEWGRTLFYAHQRLHGPDGTDPEQLPRKSDSLGWYRFEAAGVPFFVMDTRFERDANVPELLHGTQKTALEAWLDELGNDDTPKFIVSGAVFAPGQASYVEDLPSARAADNWQGFPRERAWLAREIAGRKLRNVVFLSGDYHCGAVGALSLFDGQGGSVQAYAIVSPPFYAPYPFANTRAYQVCRQETIRDPGASGKGDTVAGECRALAVEGQGFAVVRLAHDAGAWAIDVEFHQPRASAERVESMPYFVARLAGGTIDVVTNSV